MLVLSGEAWEAGGRGLGLEKFGGVKRVRSESRGTHSDPEGSLPSAAGSRERSIKRARQPEKAICESLGAATHSLGPLLEVLITSPSRQNGRMHCKHCKLSVRARLICAFIACAACRSLTGK